MKNIALRPIDEANIQDAFALELEEDQRSFVSHPMRSLALGYACRERCRAFGVYVGDRMAGYVMIVLDAGTADYRLWHFMIDRSCQGRGIGKAALNAALDHIRSRPLGPVGRILLTCNPANEVALKLYRSAGFRETGRMEKGELELELLP